MMARLPWRALPPALTPLPLDRLTRAVAAMGDADATAARLLSLLYARTNTVSGTTVDSGTSALRLAIVLAVPSGRPVALPAYGCFDLLTALVGADRRALYYDVDPATLAPDLASVEQTLRDGAAAVVVAPTFGYAPPMAELANACVQYGATLIEDIAQASGTHIDGRRLGAWGEYVTMSFGRGKGIGGAGGGALLARHADLSSMTAIAATSATRALRGTVGLALQQVLARPGVFAIPSSIPALAIGETVYHAPWPPTRAHAMQLALAYDALTVEEEAVAARRETALRVTTRLASLPALTFTTSLAGALPNYLRLGARVSPDVVSALRPFGVRRGYPISLVDHPEARAASTIVARMAGARELVAQLCSLPTHRWVTNADLDRMHHVLRANAHR